MDLRNIACSLWLSLSPIFNPVSQSCINLCRVFSQLKYLRRTWLFGVCRGLQGWVWWQGLGRWRPGRWLVDRPASGSVAVLVLRTMTGSVPGPDLTRTVHSGSGSHHLDANLTTQKHLRRRRDCYLKGVKKKEVIFRDVAMSHDSILSWFLLKNKMCSRQIMTK